MKLVITGALGHIGSRLIRELPDAFPEAEIVMLDDFSTQRYSSLFNLPRGNYRFHEVDILRGPLDAIQGADAVIHLAAVMDAVASFSQKDRVEQVNFEATDRVARACAAAGAALI